MDEGKGREHDCTDDAHGCASVTRGQEPEVTDAHGCASVTRGQEPEVTAGGGIASGTAIEDALALLDERFGVHKRKLSLAPALNE